MAIGDGPWSLVTGDPLSSISYPKSIAITITIIIVSTSCVSNLKTCLECGKSLPPQNNRSERSTLFAMSSINSIFDRVKKNH